MRACHCRRCSYGLICFCIFGLLLLPSRVLIQGSTINPRGYWATNVTQFRFFQTLANPCGFTRAIPDSPSSGQRGFLEEGSAFTHAFLRQFYLDINMAATALEGVETVFSNFQSCAGASITSLPAPQSMNGFNESSTIEATYEQGIYLTAHLHLSMIDRLLRNGRNGIPDAETRYMSSNGISYLTCSTEPDDFVPRIELVTRKLEAMLCTLVSQATTMERVNFRPALQRLTSTPIYRYNSCTELQARDCVLARGVREVLSIFKSKYKQLLGRSRAPIHRSRSRSLGNRNGNDI